MANPVILDASAVLALIQDEPGTEQLIDLLPSSIISTVNWSEAAGKLIEAGMSERDTKTVLNLGMEIVPFTHEMALQAAKLKPKTDKHKLSFSDRACLATAMINKGRVYTVVKSWEKIKIRGIKIYQLQ